MIGRPAQIPLDLPVRSASGRDDFIVGLSNSAAVDWVDRFPDWPVPTAVLCGPPGCGKSHLLSVWAEIARAPVLDATTLIVDGLADLIGETKAVAVDRADASIEPDCLFHLVNMMKERSGHLLIATREPPARWTFGRPDMRSRLAAAPLFELGTPDDALLQAVLVKLFDDRGIDAPANLIKRLLTWMPRTFDAARSLVEEVDRLSLAGKHKPSAKLVTPALQNLGFLDEDAD